ncbi:MAG: PilW family protein [Gammaproteobacteria bacterium]
MRLDQGPGHTIREQGFTLVELMIAIAISAILLLGVVQVFVISRHSYHLDNGLAHAQENARFAVHTLSEDIRMAGYIGCRAVNVANILNNQTNWMFDFDTPLQGWDGSKMSSFPSEFASKAVAGTDAIVVLRGGNTQYQITQVNGSGALASSSFQLSTTAGLSQFDIVMVSDCNQASIFQITNTTPSTNTTVVHQTGTGTPGNCTNNMGSPVPTTGCTNTSGTNYAYGLSAGMLKLVATAYYIGKSTSGTGNALYRLSMDKGKAGNPEELAEGVEDMQILYGVDTNGDGLANQYITADKVSAITDGFKKVVSVRLGLLVDTTTDVLKAATTKTFNLPGKTITDTDKKLHFPIVTTIKLRNRGVM